MLHTAGHDPAGCLLRFQSAVNEIKTGAATETIIVTLP